MKKADSDLEISSKHGLTFIVESVNPVDAGAFVVASQDEEVFGVFDLLAII